MIHHDDIEVRETGGDDPSEFELAYDGRIYQVKCFKAWGDYSVWVTGNGIEPGTCGWISSNLEFARLDSRRALAEYLKGK